jgi:hypothetical protein
MNAKGRSALRQFNEENPELHLSLREFEEIVAISSVLSLEHAIGEFGPKAKVLMKRLEQYSLCGKWNEDHPSMRLTQEEWDYVASLGDVPVSEVAARFNAKYRGWAQ